MKSEKIVIKKMGINGEGIGYIDQKIAFIKGALTGEEVLAEIDVRERRYLSGHVVKVLKKSSMRVPHH
ncbi:MAG TPA: 23S rRNA (uracil(1939)-C(5))-methyltransferase RlmD, partial [Kandleria vitulina]|nr:23S rRNA (uracil(1939)-C(5))-methyltransferase RlmD [Kandleria vitulina]